LIHYAKRALSLFIPSNTSFGLALLLVLIEFLSYIFKPISLGGRLFANLMAGHILLKVIVGFSWSMLLLEDFLIVSPWINSAKLSTSECGQVAGLLTEKNVVAP
jgi:F0F1-type ATP synthase membrane subunit a